MFQSTGGAARNMLAKKENRAPDFLLITKDFEDGLVLTLRAFGRRVFMPRETIAIAAVTSEAPNAR
jgi:hypothetical protein